MRILLLVVIAACGSSPKPAPAPPPTTSPPSEGAMTEDELQASLNAQQSIAAKCLPLIGCGCFMQCSMGFFEEPEYGEWKVNYYDTMVMAKIEDQCTDGKCTEVFAVHTCAKTCTDPPPTVKCEIARGALITCEQRP